MKNGSNGSKHIAATVGLYVALGAAIGGGFYWAGALAQAQENERKQGERRDKQFGQMDNRQRLLENQAAATQAVLTAIQRKLESMDKKLDRRR